MIWSMTCPNCRTVIVCDESYQVDDVIQCIGCCALMLVMPKDKAPLWAMGADIERLS